MAAVHTDTAAGMLHWDMTEATMRPADLKTARSQPITALPFAGAAAMGGIDWRIGTGAWTPLGATLPGTYALSDAFTDRVPTGSRSGRPTSSGWDAV
jgi:fatty acid desaturase